jgi:phage gp29-like protein
MILNSSGRPIDDFLNRGEVVPHVLSFAAIWNNISKIYSYRWDEALRHQPENALAMRRDCYIRSLLQERSMPTVNRKWQIVAENPKDQVQSATARTLTCIFQQIPRFKRLLKYLLEAIWYGRYASQVVWRQRRVQGQDRWCIVRHRPVNGDKIQFRWDGMPAVFINSTARDQYPEQLVLDTDRTPALLLAKSEWRRQFIIHQHEIDDADYFEGEMAGAVEGIGLRTMIYWAWWLRDEMLSWAVDFMKKVGSCGFWVFPYEEGSKAGKSAAERNARDAGHSVALTMPVVLDGRGNRAMEPIHVAGETSGIEALQQMISNYFERHIERLVVGQSMSSGGGGAGGLEGDGRAEFARDTKFQLLHYDADNLAETLTADLVGAAMYYNFPQFDFPMRFEFLVEDPDKKEKIEAIKTFGPMGLRFREAEVRELTGMSAPDGGDAIFGG